jgi:hypothetical protein
MIKTVIEIDEESIEKEIDKRLESISEMFSYSFIDVYSDGEEVSIKINVDLYDDDSITTRIAFPIVEAIKTPETLYALLETKINDLIASFKTQLVSNLDGKAYDLRQELRSVEEYLYLVQKE